MPAAITLSNRKPLILSIHSEVAPKHYQQKQSSTLWTEVILYSDFYSDFYSDLRDRSKSKPRHASNLTLPFYWG